MSLPTYQTSMLPLLKFAADGNEHSLGDATNAVAEAFGLSDNERNQLLPSGRKPIIDDRVGWARTYLGQARLLESTRRGYFRISKRGLELLATNPTVVNDQVLKQYQEFVEFIARKSRRKTESVASNSGLPTVTEITPEESLEDSFQSIRNSLSVELLEQIKSCSPKFFERLVVQLLVAMGYGGTLEDAGQAIGKSGDGGIDGIIKEDRLGLDIIYVQAKRWEGNVSRPEIQKFAGALLGNQARRGVFITTSAFSKEAKEYVKTIASTIILIDGDDLADLMIDYNVGVSVIANYEIKRVDSDYFVEE